MIGRNHEPADEYLVGALTDEVDRLRRLVDSSWDMQAVYDERGGILDASAASRRLFGWSRRELVGTSLYDYVHPGDLDQVREAHRRVLAGEAPVPVCYRFRCADGAHRWVEVVAVAVHEVEAIELEPATEGGSRVRREMQWTIRDIHERVEIERELRRSDERFRAAMRSTAVGIAITDAMWVLVEVNDAFAQMFRTSAAELLGRHLDMLAEPVAPFASDGRSAMLARRELESYHVEQRYRRADGSTFPAEAEISAVLDVDGEVVSHVVVMRDITDRLAARSIEEAAARHHRNELLGRVAGGVAHHCNNLLAVIRLEVEMARAPAGLDPATLMHLAAISDAVDRATVFARELLLFSGQGPRHVTEVDVREVVTRSAALLQHTPESGVLLTTEIDASACVVRADERELESVVFALVLNALGAVVGGGSVRVEVASRTRGDGPPELSADVSEWVRLRVSDDGEGMDELVRSRAFEPFFTTRADGSGMGLAVVERSVHDAGGVVELHSEVGRGTVVDVWLPAATAGRGPIRSGDLEVLVVDDQPEILELAARVLERAGHRVQRRSSGEEAIGLIREGSLDVLVTDLVMPGMSGQELIAATRSERPTVGVVVITGFPGDSERSLPPDAEVVTKPFRSSQLVEAVRRVAPSRAPDSD